MTTQRFERLFAALKAKNEGAFVPFVNLFDPNEDLSLEILETLIAAGADALELGIPFSDPSADGPVIMVSANRALDAGSTTAKCLAIVKRLRERHPDVPMSIMLYANLVYAPGQEKFFAMCEEAGVDVVLIPDLPVEMREMDQSFDMAAANHGIGLVSIAPPNARPEQLALIAHVSKGYVYLLSRPGITGENNPAHKPAEALIEGLEKAGAAPGLLGFGVSKPEHVRAALASGAAGVIVGSAIVRIINEHFEEPEVMKEKITEYVRGMKAATLPPAK